MNLWIDPATGRTDRTTGHSRNCLSLRNGILDIDWLLAGRDDALVPHTPAWFSTIWCDYPFDPDADCPRWKAVLSQNLEADQERIALLQEWAGYCLTPSTDEQKFLILEGDGANGKSVYCAGLEAILGHRNVSHISLDQFGQQFALESTLNKLANIAGDTGDLDKVAEGNIKAFTSGNPMTIDRKYIRSLEVLPTARLVLATNTRPRFADRTEGIWRRMLLVPFRRRVPDSERVKGMDKASWWLRVAGEVPGMLNWAIAGLVRLRAQGGFTEASVCREAVEDYRIEVNPAREFLREFCEPVAVGSVTAMDLYKAYTEWVRKTGHKPLGERTFAKEVVREFPKVTRERLRVGSTQGYHYISLAYNAPDKF